jgi:hypothetical protein
MSRLALWVVIAALGGAGCQGQRCSAETCTGCCDAAGECVAGSQQTSCGTNGATCAVCAADRRCSRGDCVVPTSGGVAGGGSATGGGSAAGGAAGGAAAGGSGGGDAFAGTLDAGINDVLGKRCTTMTRESLECPSYRGLRPDCGSRVTPSGASTVCHFICEADGGCAGGRGRCSSFVWAAGVCQECVFRCTGADGGQNDCEANERCVDLTVPGFTGSLCVPDCRLRGNRCSLGECQASGLCTGTPALHCMRY